MSETFDFIVIGSGGGSMCAALQMRAAGKSVLILEKTDLVGGTTAASGGVMWIPNNRFMKSEGIEDSAEKANAYLDAVVGDSKDAAGASRERRLAYVEQAPEMINFLVDQGIQLRRIPSWPDYYDVAGASVPGRAVVSQLFDIKKLGVWKEKLRPGFLPLPANLDEAMQLPLIKRSGKAKKVLARIIGRVLVDKITGKQRATAGQALQGQMLHAALKAGVGIRLNAAVKEIIVENDRVTGVIVGVQKISARLGVLINAGGFARNQRMLDQYIPGTSADWSSTIDADTGEMIEEGQRIGAATAQMAERIGMQISLPPGSKSLAVKPGMQNDICKPHAIVVDQTGVRYAGEACSHAEFSQRMIERNKIAPASPSWMIFDSQYLATYMLAGTMPGAKKPKSWTEEHFLRSGDTVEALAASCGLDASTLKASVERFNGFSRKGRDEDFQRGDHPYDQWTGDPLSTPSNTLGTIEKAPFFAVQILPGDVGTYGGLVTDTHARVLRADGSVIEGLYATGTSTASVMGRVEPGPGGSIGPSFTWGYVAAKHAINNVKN
ncbi:FAD-binding protein [Stenotrophobium rhamnosiphilum]|uniref:3-ketosteroid-delta-1-dehydrogenase n=1 Tax=Stenotrophobium rhamnosiphilum TaxID=2029166 RepID=A0A2T5MCZ2_9GAMM|nr:FAD-binding protein [Stenotrophobium rhamnosiphilum]PTU30443.1 3-ketosteroid-delta-1-dehydrogenase [Stenotrophobium rhamnosiphilum]